jgi:hypothetical protein
MSELRDKINAIGQTLRELREPYDTTFIIEIESIPTCPDTLKPSFAVTVNNGYKTSRAHSVELYDAFYMARMQLRNAIAETEIETVQMVVTPKVPSVVPKFTIDPSKLVVPKK